MEVDAFAAGGGGDEELCAVLIPESFSGFDLVFERSTLDRCDLFLAENASEFDAKELQRLPILSEDDESLAPFSARSCEITESEPVELPVGAFRHEAEKLAHLCGFVGNLGIAIDALVTFLVRFQRPLRFLFASDELPHHALASLRDVGVGLRVVE